MLRFLEDVKPVGCVCHHPKAMRQNPRAAKRKREEVQLRGQPGHHPSDWAVNDPAVRGHHKTAGIVELMQLIGGNVNCLIQSSHRTMTTTYKGIQSSLWFEFTAAVNQKAQEIWESGNSIPKPFL